jgi:hypothetical protein
MVVSFVDRNLIDGARVDFETSMVVVAVAEALVEALVEAIAAAGNLDQNSPFSHVVVGVENIEVDIGLVGGFHTPEMSLILYNFDSELAHQNVKVHPSQMTRTRCFGRPSQKVKMAEGVPGGLNQFVMNQNRFSFRCYQEASGQSCYQLKFG